MTTSRREFIAGTGAAIALAHLPARAAEDADAAAQKLLAEFAEEMMVDYPASRANCRTARPPASRRLRSASQSGWTA